MLDESISALMNWLTRITPEGAVRDTRVHSHGYRNVR